MDVFSTPDKPLVRSVLKEINSNNKSGSGTPASPIKPMHAALESDLSGFETTISPAVDSPDVSYTKPSLDVSDLLSNFNKLNVHNGNDTRPLSSDEESFQECENDLETTIQTTPTHVRANTTIDLPTYNENTTNLVTSTVNVDDEEEMQGNIADISNDSEFFEDAEVGKPLEFTDFGNISGSNSLQKSFVVEAAANITATSIRSGDLNVTVPITNARLDTTVEIMNSTAPLEPEAKPTKTNASISLNVTNDGGLSHSFSATENTNANNDDDKIEEISSANDSIKASLVESFGNGEFETVASSDVALDGALSVPAISVTSATPRNSFGIPTSPPNEASAIPNIEVAPATPVARAASPNEIVTVSSPAEVDSNTPLIEVESIPSTADTITTSNHSNEQLNKCTPTMDVAASRLLKMERVSGTPLINSVASNSPSVAHLISPSVNVEESDEATLSQLIEDVLETDDLNNVLKQNVLDTTTEVTQCVNQPALAFDNSPTPDITSSYPSDEPMDIEEMDVDMDGTIDIPSTTNDAHAIQSSQLLNETVDMTDLGIEQALSNYMNATTVVDEMTESNPSQANIFGTSFDTKKATPKTINAAANQTFAFMNETASPANQTFAMPSQVESAANQTFAMPEEAANQTFAMPTNIESTVNQTFAMPHKMEEVANQTFAMPSRMEVSAPKSLDETVVIGENAGNINATFVATDTSPKQPMDETTSQYTPMENLREKLKGLKENIFKKPTSIASTSSKASDPFGDIKNQFTVSDDEFASPSFILNPTDFDFLLSKGTSGQQVNPRDSILERFDPISGRKSIHAPSNPVKTDSVPTPLIASIPEADNSAIDSTNGDVDTSLVNIEVKTNLIDSQFINTTFDDPIVKLDSSDTIDLNQLVDGDNSQASSTTETYETASSGEPPKVVTMSVGLIQDMNMENMKSLNDINDHQPMQMNDEKKAKQEMSEIVERKLKEAEAREEALLRRITEKEKALNKMSAVVENYEKTMVEMISEREQTSQNFEKQISQLKSERDSNFHHLMSLENTFSDLHVKYEKSKQMALEVRDKEGKLIEKLDFCQQQMKLQEQRYDKLKNHALTQLENANLKLETLSKAHTNDMKKLTAQLKKEEISRQSIMDQLAQKTKENAELVKICDELINNAGDAS